MDDKTTILISEKEYADSRIGSYFEIQVKLLGLTFTSAIAVTGWIFAVESEPTKTALILLAVVAISSLAILLGTVYNGFALAYIHYKKTVLGPELKEYLQLKANPLSALVAGNEAPARKPILFSTIVLAIGHSLFNVAIFVSAFRIPRDHWGCEIMTAFFLVGVLLVCSIYSQWLFLRGLKRILQ